MSYDVYAYESPSGSLNLDEALTVIEKFGNNEPCTSDNAKTARKELLAQALLEHNPKLERFTFDYQEIAKFQNITVEQAKIDFNHIEINTPEDGNGIQITIFNDYATVTVPYWYQGAEAAEVFTEIWDYLKIFRKRAGYFIYDLQLEIAFDPEKETRSSLEYYEKVVKSLPEMVTKMKMVNGRPALVEETTSANKKPWWKFW